MSQDTLQDLSRDAFDAMTPQEHEDRRRAIRARERRDQRREINESAIDLLTDCINDDQRYRKASEEFSEKCDAVQRLAGGLRSSELDGLLDDLDSLAALRAYKAADAVARAWLQHQGYAALDDVMTRPEPESEPDS
jgi:hypothetical protein